MFLGVYAESAAKQPSAEDQIHELPSHISQPDSQITETAQPQSKPSFTGARQRARGTTDNTKAQSNPAPASPILNAANPSIEQGKLDDEESARMLVSTFVLLQRVRGLMKPILLALFVIMALMAIRHLIKASDLYISM